MERPNKEKLAYICGACGAEFHPPMLAIDGVTEVCPVCQSTNFMQQTVVCTGCNEVHTVLNCQYVPPVFETDEVRYYCKNCLKARQTRFVENMAIITAGGSYNGRQKLSD